MTRPAPSDVGCVIAIPYLLALLVCLGVHKKIPEANCLRDELYPRYHPVYRTSRSLMGFKQTPGLDNGSQAVPPYLLDFFPFGVVADLSLLGYVRLSTLPRHSLTRLAKRKKSCASVACIRSFGRSAPGRVVLLLAYRLAAAVGSL
jgi:hypothetical protein